MELLSLSSEPHGAMQPDVLNSMELVSLNSEPHGAMQPDVLNSMELRSGSSEFHGATWLVMSSLEQNPFWEVNSNLFNVDISPTIYGTRRSITVFTRVYYWPLSLARCIAVLFCFPKLI